MGKFIRKDSVAPLCKCGCGKKVTKSKLPPYNWNKFIKGHYARFDNPMNYPEYKSKNQGKNHWNYGNDKYANEKSRTPPICACGCGNPVRWNYILNKWNKFIQGHYIRVNNPMKRPEVAKKQSESLKALGDNHPSKRPEVRRSKSKKFAGKNNPNYGKITPEETRKKISKSLIELGDSHPSKNPKLRKKHSKRMSGKNHPLFGKHHSETTKQKISISHTGYKHSSESCLKMSLSRSGNKHHNWKGGISCEPYCDAWADQEYKESIRQRDNYTCQNPDCRNNCNHLTLCVHHINHNKMNCHPWNLISLCRSCNVRADTNEQYWETLYQNILFEKYNYKALAA